MKKSLSAVLVILLSLIGANALASKLDVHVHKVVAETSDKGASQNGDSHGGGGGGGTRNMVTMEK